MLKVRNLCSPRSGREVANQFEIYDTDNGIKVFQSYDSIIVKIDNINGRVYLDESYWNYSSTTIKYRNIFLGEDSKTTLMKIKNGEYLLTNLN